MSPDSIFTSRFFSTHSVQPQNTWIIFLCDAKHQNWMLSSMSWLKVSILGRHTFKNYTASFWSTSYFLGMFGDRLHPIWEWTWSFLGEIITQHSWKSCPDLPGGQNFIHPTKLMLTPCPHIYQCYILITRLSPPASPHFMRMSENSGLLTPCPEYFQGTMQNEQ